MLTIKRHLNNPIIRPGSHPWRQVASFNPGVFFVDGYFYLYERAAQSLRPLICNIGLWKSPDGVNFTLVKDEPIMSATQLGFPDGTIEDPRVVTIEGRYYMTYAYRPHTFNCYPTGAGLPEYHPLIGNEEDDINFTMSSIAVSDDLINFKTVTTINSVFRVDDRNVVLFPSKINGRYALLRRPKQFIGNEFGCDEPSIWISYSNDLKSWQKPILVASAQEAWEGGKIGCGTPPIKTPLGWLLFYHGVDKNDTYRIGAMILDEKDPTKVLFRTKNFLIEPTEYYEKFGLIIPNVVFPTGAVIKDDEVYLYYGVCDTAIALATMNLKELLKHLTAQGSKRK